MDGCAEEGGEGEERTGEGLSGAVSGEEGLLINPTAIDHGGFEKRQDDVASAEDEGSGAVEGVEHRDGLRACERSGEGKSHEQQEEKRGGDEGCRLWQAEAERMHGRWLRGAGQDESECGSDGDGREGAVGEEDDEGRDEGESEAKRIRREGLTHGENGLGDDGDGDELESVNDAGAEASGEEAVAEGEGQHDERGRHGEGSPSGEAAEPSGAEESEGEADLTAGGAGEGLGDGDDFGKGFAAAPTAALDELGLEITEMSDGASEGKQAKTEKGEEDFAGGAVGGLRRVGGCGHELVTVTAKAQC